MKRIIIYIFLLGLIAISCKKEGCMDEIATNYSAEAEKNDGSCEYPPLPTIWRVDFNIFNSWGNFTCGYVNLIMKKQDGSSEFLLNMHTEGDGSFDETGPFQELLDLGYERGNSLEVQVFGYGGPGTVDSKVVQIPYTGAIAYMHLSTFVVE
jgi:hypothetical protein